MAIKKNRIIDSIILDDTPIKDQNIKKVDYLLYNNHTDDLSDPYLNNFDYLIVAKSSNVRTLKDMTKDEIKQLEKLYNAKIIKPKEEK